MTFASGSISNPFQLNDLRGDVPLTNNGYNFVGDRTPVNPNSLSGRVKVMLLFGQSNIANSGSGGTLTPANPTRIINLNIWNGGLYRAVDPLLGGDGVFSALGTKLADTLITDNYADYVVLVPGAIGATTIAQWASGGICNHRIGVASRRCEAIGLTPTHFLWQQGESDTAAGTLQAAYTTGLNSVIATVQALMACPIFVARTSWYNGAVSSAIQAAQAAAVAGNIYAGANTDSLDNTNRSFGTDLTFAGMQAAAALWTPIIEAH